MTHGAIEWIEFPAKDPSASAKFFETVFGWKIQRQPQMEEYPMFTDAGGKVGGGFTRQAAAVAAGGVFPYISVEDIDAILKTINANGCETVQAKKEISPEIGSWASFRDPGGNTIGLYQGARPNS